MAGVFFASQVKDLNVALDNLKAAKAVLTRSHQNLLEEKGNSQPKNSSGTTEYTSQGDFKDVTYYLSAGNEEIQKKINYFESLKYLFNFLATLGFILEVLAFFLPDDQERGRQKQT